VSEGGLEHATAGNFPGSGKSCRQNTGPLAGGVNLFPGKGHGLCTRMSAPMRRLTAWPVGPPARRPPYWPRALPRSAAPVGVQPQRAGQAGAGSPSVTESAAQQARYPPLGRPRCSSAQARRSGRSALRGRPDLPKVVRYTGTFLYADQHEHSF
jgi:hypothetical protein